MRTVRTKVYTFAELSATAQQKALDHFRDSNVDYEWFTFVYDYFKEQNEGSGFEFDKFYFSGFYSQGDGAMFEGSVTDFTKFTEGVDRRVVKLLGDNKIDLSCSIVHVGRYCHSYSAMFDFNIDPETEGTENIMHEVRKITKNVRSVYHSLCSNLYDLLSKNYEALVSDEAVKETIESNEYEFYANGDFHTTK